MDIATLAGWLAVAVLGGGTIWVIVGSARAKKEPMAPEAGPLIPSGVTEVLGVAVYCSVCLGIGLMGLYGLIRFVKWAWTD